MANNKQENGIHPNSPWFTPHEAPSASVMGELGITAMSGEPVGVVKDVAKAGDEVIAMVELRPDVSTKTPVNVGFGVDAATITGAPVYVSGKNTATALNETQRAILEVCANLEIESRNNATTIVDIFFSPVQAFSTVGTRASVFVDDVLASVSRGYMPADAYTIMSAIVYLRIARRVKTSIVRADIDHMIAQECREIGNLLIEKNRAYGNSALDPVRLFSKATPEEQILVRLDDKISRLMRGSAAGEDVEKDLLGYLVLLKVCRMRKGNT